MVYDFYSTVHGVCLNVYCTCYIFYRQLYIVSDLSSTVHGV